MAYESEKEQDLDHAVARTGQVMDVHLCQSVHPSEKEQENLDCEGVTVARTRTGQVTQTYVHPSPCLVHRVQIHQHGPLLVRVHPSEKEQENLDHKGVTAARTRTGQVTQTYVHPSPCPVHRVQIHQHGALLVHVWCVCLYFEMLGTMGTCKGSMWRAKGIACTISTQTLPGIGNHSVIPSLIIVIRSF